MLDIIEDKGPSDSYLGKYYTRMTIGEYSRPHPFASSKFDIRKILYFPLPVDLRDSTSVGYSNQNLETVGDLINGNFGSGLGAAALRNAGPIIKNTLTEVGGVVGMATANFGGKYAEAANLIGGKVNQAIGKVFGEDQITSAIQQATGLAPNPNPSIMFTGPELRDFSHSWTFYPKNESESEKIQTIIRILKQSALPQNRFSGSAAVLKYPNMVQLNFYPWDDRSPIDAGKGSAANEWGWTKDSILRYKKCVMRNVNVNYTPAGAPGFFHGGKNGAVAISITINFLEIEYMLAGDWSGDGIGGTDTSTESFGAAVASAVSSAASAVGEALGSATQRSGASVGSSTSGPRF